MTCPAHAERTRIEHRAVHVLNWTSAMDLGCWGFVMRQTCGYREQLNAARSFWQDTITNPGASWGFVVAAGHGVKVA